MTLAETDAAARASVAAWEIPGAAVAVVQGDAVVYLEGIGVREQGQAAPVTPDTRFAIASATKAFTCTALAMLEDDGKLRWDDPVRKYIDFFRLYDPLADANVTLRDLVTHRTGVSRHDALWYRTDLSREEIIRRIAYLKPNTSFRSAYEYNNIMYLTAGVALGNAAGSSWEAVIQSRIFDPLGMAGANFSVTEVVKSSDYALPHHQERDGPLEVLPWLNLDACAPGGAINAGVSDLSRWLRFQLADGMFEGKRLLAAERLLETRAPQIVIPRDAAAKEMMPHTHFSSYGLGWTIYDYHGHLVVSHAGGIDGFRSHVALVPEARLGIAILSNRTPTLMPEALRNRLIDLALGLPSRDWDAFYIGLQKKQQAEARAKEREAEKRRYKRTRPSRELAAYAGDYEHPAYGAARIALDAGALTLHYQWIRIPLQHVHFDTFLVKQETSPAFRETLTFTLNAEGEIHAMTLFGQEFTRREKGQH